MNDGFYFIGSFFLSYAIIAINNCTFSEGDANMGGS